MSAQVSLTEGKRTSRLRPSKSEIDPVSDFERVWLAVVILPGDRPEPFHHRRARVGQDRSDCRLLRWRENERQ